ncbi:FecR family protein [Autumnicola musiva]|uniref:DUF4974 domain-containing protein n=1 Tax=Autumnicola musiva TaxID=3075589 RepID=A0ABU3D933_9FLAO|nr:FecR domain-containing protein [Zunongwangia sp. F117]MDT0677961.1 DUF4974 domain-containing protein [Zunongwangia sp. F117]
MNQIEKVLDYSKKLAEAVFKGKDIPTYKKDFPLQEEDINEVVKDFREQDSNHQKLLNEIDTEKDWEELSLKISPAKRRFSFMKYAAVFLVIFGISALFFMNHQPEEGQQPYVISAGTDKATLTLGNGESIVLTKGDDYSDENAHAEDSRLVYNSKVKNQKLIFNSLTIPRGGQFFVRLSDGTKVWMNSETKLKYPVHFIEGQPRKVELLYGEAYFEVTHSTEHRGDSFVVQTEGQEIEVLGTQFNITAYKETQTICTTLVKGRVSIENQISQKLLKPGQQATNTGNNELIKIKDVDVSYSTAWKDGLFMFHNEPLEKMMAQLSRWYDIEVIFKNSKKKRYTFSGTLEREDNITKLLNTLEKTGEVKFNIKENKIMIK